MCARRWPRWSCSVRPWIRRRRMTKTNTALLPLESYLALPYTIRVTPDPSGGYVADVEELPGCISQGETWEEAGEMIRDAMSAWIAVHLEDGRPVPVPRTDNSPSRVLLRLPHSLHRELQRAAEREGISL